MAVTSMKRIDSWAMKMYRFADQVRMRTNPQTPEEIAEYDAAKARLDLTGEDAIAAYTAVHNETNRLAAEKREAAKASRLQAQAQAAAAKQAQADADAEAKREAAAQAARDAEEAKRTVIREYRHARDYAADLPRMQRAGYVVESVIDHTESPTLAGILVKGVFLARRRSTIVVTYHLAN